MELNPVYLLNYFLFEILLLYWNYNYSGQYVNQADENGLHDYNMTPWRQYIVSIVSEQWIITMQITHADSFHNYALIIPECGITQHEKERPDVCWSLYQLKDYLNMWLFFKYFWGILFIQKRIKKRLSPTFPECSITQHKKEILYFIN